MNVICPACFSEDVVRASRQQYVDAQSNASMANSAAFATLGASLSKGLALPVPPVVGGIAGALVGGLLNDLLGGASTPSQSIQVRYFHCRNCQYDFQ